MRGQRGAAVANWAGGHLVGGGCVGVFVCYRRVALGAGRRQLRQRCSAVRGVDVGGGYGVGRFAGSPWREAQQSLMLSGSERGRGKEG